MRVKETQGSASGEDAGNVDTRYDVRTEVQDGLLQLASGKRVPSKINCGACGGKESARELNLPTVKGLVGDKTVDVLRDTGCEGVMVRRGLVDDNQLTGKCCLIFSTRQYCWLKRPGFKSRHLICLEKWRRYAYRRSYVILLWETSRVFGTQMALI